MTACMIELQVCSDAPIQFLVIQREVLSLDTRLSHLLELEFDYIDTCRTGYNTLVNIVLQIPKLSSPTYSCQGSLF